MTGAFFVSGYYLLDLGMVNLRRIRLDLMHPAEKIIYEAIQEVEKVGADTGLTDAIILLSQAKDKVSDYLDKVYPEAIEYNWANDRP